MAGISVNFEVLNQLNTPTLYADTLALRPAPSIVGRIFFRTDVPYGIYRDTGTSWDLISSVDTTGITGSIAAGQVGYGSGTNTLAGSNNLFWDATNSRLGIKTVTPGVELDVHGSGTILQLNGTTTNNSFLMFQNAGTNEWRIGNNYSAGTNYFSIFDSSNNIETIKITAGATNVINFTAQTNFSENLVLSNAASAPRIQIQRQAASTTLKPELILTVNAGYGSLQKLTTTTNAYKTIASHDFALLNSDSGGDITLMNDFLTGKIKFAGGGVSTAQMTLTSAGRLLIGTTTESTFLLDVNGTARIQNNFDISASVGASGSVYGQVTNSNNAGQARYTATNSSGDTTSLQTFGSNFGDTQNARKGAVGSSRNMIIISDGNTASGGTSFAIELRPGGYNPAANALYLQNGAACIGLGVTSINASAVLQADSTTKGFLPPRMTTAQKNAITTPAAGLVVYDTTLNKLCVRTAAAWETITSA